MTIVPDGKDWTWVLGRPCPECGLDTQAFAREEIPAMIRANAAAWRRALAAADAAERPRPDRWSALEYGCHVRDVFRLYDYRLGLMLADDDPLYPNWDQDETAVAEDYGSQDPAVAAAELAAAGDAVAASFAAISGDQWLRPGRRSDGAAFTVETFGRYFIHDPVHHLYDVTGLRAAGLPALGRSRSPVGYASDRFRVLSATPATSPIGVDGVADRRRSGSMAWATGSAGDDEFAGVASLNG